MVVAELFKVAQSYFQKKSGSPGTTLILEGSGLGKGTVSIPSYGPAGIHSRPAKNARFIALPVGEGRRELISIACHDYDIHFVIGEGETTIYSTSSDGKTVKARIDLDNTGKIAIYNSSKSLKTILSNLISGIQGLTYIPYPGGVAGPPVPVVDSTGKVASALSDLALLLKDGTI